MSRTVVDYWIWGTESWIWGADF